METLHPVTQYLQNPTTYEEGLLLLGKYGKNKHLHGLLSAHRGDFFQSKLITHLKEIKLPVTSKKGIIKIDRDSLPDNLATEYDKTGEIIRIISNLHARLSTAQSDAERKGIADSIIHYWDKRKSIFKMLERYMETGINPTDAETRTTKPDETTELLILKTEKEIKLLSSRRSKLKKNPARAIEFKMIDEQIGELREKLKSYAKEGKV